MSWAVLGCALFIGTTLYFAWQAARSRKLAQRLAAEKEETSQRAARAESENSQLARYRHIADAEREAARLHEALNVARASAENETSALLRQAALQAESTIDAADKKSAGIISETERRSAATVLQAEERARTILQAAAADATRVAGDAVDALRNAEMYRREVSALENVIKGYGDRYIVPTHSVLDDMAESYGFAEAGESLKQARQRTRTMIVSGAAATCDYVEPHRRQTAVAFVTDAFNGKVDSILSTVKEDNVGTLRQKILDAFTLVNMNGEAFRRARILDGYLNARLEELRLAAAVHELRNRDRDEQRRVKEQIREEEKARRDYERAIRDAEKEEELLKKAMEKVQQQVAKASDAQRAKFEAQLAELGEKLRLAEERSQRALSMAQQTKTGHVYVISNVGSFGENVLKIGLTRRLEPLDRIRELGDASVPFEFDVHAMILSEDAPALEHALHRHFVASQVNKVNPRKEFFRVSLDVIRAEIEKLGIKASWTIAAGAAEYRQSLAIEKAIRENPASYQAWINKQLVLDAQIEATDDRDMAEAS